MSYQSGSEKELLSTTEAGLQGLRAGNGMVYGHGVNSICQKFPEGGRSRDNQPPFYFFLLTPTRPAKEDLLPPTALVGIAFDPEKQEERMDEKL